MFHAPEWNIIVQCDMQATLPFYGGETVPKVFLFLTINFFIFECQTHLNVKLKFLRQTHLNSQAHI